jgi:hypothetical protein
MDPGSHVGFQISTKNTNPVEDHPMNISGKLKSVQRFQRRRFKCERLMDGRTDGWTDDRRLPMTKAHMAYGQVS